MSQNRPGRRHRIWLISGGAGFLIGLVLFAVSGEGAVRHLALILMIAAPVIAFWRVMKPKLAPHCPRPVDWPKP